MSQIDDMSRIARHAIRDDTTVVRRTVMFTDAVTAGTVDLAAESGGAAVFHAVPLFLPSGGTDPVATDALDVLLVGDVPFVALARP